MGLFSWFKKEKPAKEDLIDFESMYEGVDELGVAFHIPGQDTDEALAPYKGINNGLEDLGGEGILRFTFLDFTICWTSADGDLEIWRRQVFHNAIH